jgi:polysaccharide biosynthesis/export protein VpsN
MDFMKFLGRGQGALALALTAILLAGCGTDGNYKYDPLRNAAQTSPAAPAATNNTLAGIPGLTPPPGTNIPGLTNEVPADPTQTLMQLGDALVVNFSDIPNPMPASEDTIKEDGTITLPYNQKFVAAGKTVGTLQAEIRERYVTNYWKFLTVSIKIADRYYYVGGETRIPGRQVYIGKISVLKAIDTTGGFTDYAAKWRVEITRANGAKLIEDCNKAVKDPSLDYEIFPNDRIFVPKRWF